MSGSSADPMTRDDVERAGLKVARGLAEFLEREALPGTGVDPDGFWSGFSSIVHDLGPVNAALLARRVELQSKIDARHIAPRGAPNELEAYKTFV